MGDLYMSNEILMYRRNVFHTHEEFQFKFKRRQIMSVGLLFSRSLVTDLFLNFVQLYDIFLID